MDAEERIEATRAIINYLKERYENITISDTTQILKMAQLAVYQKDENAFVPPIL